MMAGRRARPGERATEGAARHIPVLLDEVLAALKNNADTRDIPVVMLTARQQEADILRGFSLGAEDYVTKPFSPMELVARIKRTLRRVP